MNYISLPIRRASIWHDDHGGSSHNMFIPGRRRSGTFNVRETNEPKPKPAKQETSGLSKTLKKLRVIVRNKKYQNVDWHRITINIGGRKFSVYKGTLKQQPDTKLANLTEESEEFDALNNEYFFDRNPCLFQFILDVYRFGETHFPRYCCPMTVKDELLFWGLGIKNLSSCCRKYFCDGMDEILTYETLQAEFDQVPDKLYGVESHVNSFNDIPVYRRNTWSFLDDPQSSVGAKIWAYVNMILIALSILSLFAGTLSSCRVVPSGGIFNRHVKILSNDNSAQDLNTDTGNTTESTSQTQPSLLENKKIKMLLTTQPHEALLYIDLLCMIFFTVEFCVRFYVCPRRLRLLKRMSTIVDLLYLFPIWLLFLIDFVDQTFWHDSSRIVGLLILKNLMVLRVFRIFRLFRHYRGLKLLQLAIRASINELFLLFVFVLFSITVFASLIYCAEIFNDKEFDSLFISLWWSLITMTTVGYGDFYPRTWPGYLVGSVCALTGIIIIGLVVPIIASNFHSYYGLNIINDNKKTTPQDIPLDVESQKPRPVDADSGQEENTTQEKEDKEEIMDNVVVIKSSGSKVSPLDISKNSEQELSEVV